MKTRLSGALPVLVIVLAFASCSVQKRIYMAGYHTEWRINKQVSPAKVKRGGKVRTFHGGSAAGAVADVAAANSSAAPTTMAKAPEAARTDLRQHPTADVPVFIEGDQVVSLMWDSKNGVGTMIAVKPSGKTSARAGRAAASGGSKNQTIALFLCILVGFLGIHRFYLGHFGMGVLYLLTFGLCGIGWFTDIFKIAFGELKPRNGEYKEKQ